MKPLQLVYCSQANFGDALAPRLIEHITGRKVVFGLVNHAELMAVGSVLFSGYAYFGARGAWGSRQWAKAWYHQMMNLMLKPLCVWGSGFLEEVIAPKDCVPYRELSVYAVRGPLTHRQLVEHRCAGLRDGIAYGDPGLFYRDLVPGIESLEKTYDLTIVPHYRDKDVGLRFGAKLAQQGVRVKVTDVENPDPLQVLRDIAAANQVLSSSLHGLIVADSLGVPNRFFKAGNDEPFKFRDYYAAYDLAFRQPLHLDDFDRDPKRILREIGETAYVGLNSVAAVREDLVKAFPRQFMGMEG